MYLPTKNGYLGRIESSEIKLRDVEVFDAACCDETFDNSESCSDDERLVHDCEFAFAPDFRSGLRSTNTESLKSPLERKSKSCGTEI